MSDTPSAEEGSDEYSWSTVGRRSLIRAAGASTLFAFGAGSAVAQSDDDGGEETPSGSGDDSQTDEIDPIFGRPSAGPNPCMGDASENCFESFDVQPSHEVEMQLDLPEELFPFAAPGVLEQETIDNINAAVADGTVDTDELDDPDVEVTAQTSAGEEVTLTVEEIATLLADTLAFYFEPAGLAVEPGDVVLFSAETPDHAFTAYQERHGRQNRVPDDVGPISSPLVPVGGYWLYRFETEGVYDAYCPPHEPFGMAMRVVVGDETDSADDGDDAEEETTTDSGDDVETTTTADSGDDMDEATTTPGDDADEEMDGEPAEDAGRPPTAENSLASVFGGLDPNLPSSAAVLETPVLAPETIVSDGNVSWQQVVDAYRSESKDGDGSEGEA